MSGGSGSNPSGSGPNIEQRISGNISNQSFSYFLKDLRSQPSIGKRSANSGMTNYNNKVISIGGGGSDNNRIIPFSSMNGSDVNMRQSFIYKSNGSDSQGRSAGSFNTNNQQRKFLSPLFKSYREHVSTKHPIVVRRQFLNYHY